MKTMTATMKFPQIEHEGATGELGRTFTDIEDTLRVPWVAFACRVMAGFPGFLVQAFQAAKPHFSTVHSERAADAIRRMAVMPGTGLRDPREKLNAMGWTDKKIGELMVVLDAFNYGNPKYLLLITGWCETIQGRLPRGEPLLASDMQPIPRGRPAGVPSMHHMIHEDKASPEVLALYDRITRMHYHHGPASDYRVLANYPDFLNLAINDVLTPVVRTVDYDLKQRDLVQAAREWVHSLPAPAGVSPAALLSSCSPHEIAGLTGLLFMYQRFIADITIDVIRLKQLFDGEAAAGANPFQ